YVLLLPPPPTSTLFPYTTLFRSRVEPADASCACCVEHLVRVALEGGDRLVGAEVVPVAEVHVARPAEGREAKADVAHGATPGVQDRKSTRLNSSHVAISYAVFCL